MPKNSFYSFEGSKNKPKRAAKPEEPKTQTAVILPSMPKDHKKQETPQKKSGLFERIADFASKIVGSPSWFMFSLFIVFIWGLSGFFIGFGESWHLVIHTITSIVTLLIMALLHTSQRKWEERMIKLENHQEKVLELLEKDIAEIKEDLNIHKQKLQDHESKHNTNDELENIRQPQYLASNMSPKELAQTTINEADNTITSLV